MKNIYKMRKKLKMLYVHYIKAHMQAAWS